MNRMQRLCPVTADAVDYVMPYFCNKDEVAWLRRHATCLTLTCDT